MTTWQFLKIAVREIGVYKRKLFFFVLLIGLGVAVYLSWYYWGAAQASPQFGAKTPYKNTNQVLMEVNVSADGRVFVDNKKQSRAINFFPEYDELRILVFDNPGRFIAYFQAAVRLPEPVSQEQIQPIIYAVHGIGFSRAYLSDPQTIVYEATDISPQATLSIVANLPKGMVKPGPWYGMEYYLTNLPVKVWLVLAIILPSLTLILLIFMILKRRAGRIFSVKKGLTLPPEDIPPALAGVLIDGTCGAREIAATLIDLARRGYIFIINKGEGKFSFGIRQSGNLATMKGLAPFEKVLLEKIFSPKTYKSTVEDVEMRIGHHVFSRRIAQFYLEIYNQATRQGYFVKNPARVHLIYKVIGVILFFLCFMMFLLGALVGADPKYGLFFWVGGMAAALVAIKIAPFMSARSSYGRQALDDWLAFGYFLRQRKKAESIEALESKFEKYLPYAIVLGAEAEWAKRFGQKPFRKPDWYDSREWGVTLEGFANQLFPLIGYVAANLARAHEPSVE